MKMLPIPKNITLMNRTTPSEYPHSGIYDTSTLELDSLTKFVTIVSKRKNIVYLMEYEMMLDALDNINEEPLKTSIENTNNINDILRVIAVTSNPELMKDLLK